MRTHFIFCFAIAALFAITACGEKNSYKAAYKRSDLNRAKKENPNAGDTLEVQAEQILGSDKVHVDASASLATKTLREEVKGLSVAMNLENGKTTIHSALVLSKNGVCEDRAPMQGRAVESAPLKNSFVQVDAGRLRCLDENCAAAIFLVESSKTIYKNADDKVGVSEVGSVAILLSKGSDGMMVPANTQSKAFLTVLNYDSAMDACEKQQSGSAGQIEAPSTNRAATATRENLPAANPGAALPQMNEEDYADMIESQNAQGQKPVDSEKK